MCRKIYSSGYMLMYLTSRSIGQADSTREYLNRQKYTAKQLKIDTIKGKCMRLILIFLTSIFLVTVISVLKKVFLPCCSLTDFHTFCDTQLCREGFIFLPCNN